ncbi:MAG TPA: primosomal protein N' [Deltaproteobacteria bacterium]|nr:primosomal protein N' [Deltaproteobacteria bacterium]
MPYLDVALPVPLNQIFTYFHENADIPLSQGMRLLVPFGRRKMVGIVTKIHDQKPDIEIKKIETILDDQSHLSPSFLEWLDWASRYYFYPLGETLHTALPSSFYKPVSLKTLQQKKTRPRLTPPYPWHDKELTLTSPQQKILETLLKKKSENQNVLLHGITGSGKTEIYLELIETVLKEGKQVLFLVPEIGLTPQIEARFEKRFSGQMGLYHSELTENQKLSIWFQTHQEKLKLVVGTRSALFLPFQNLGLIVIDEEHDTSYKQEERFCYHARDLALVRAKMEKAFVVMGSATPSFESYINALNGKYALLHLKERPTGAKLPQIDIVDMNAEKRQANNPMLLSRKLLESIGVTLQKKEQTLILLNKRGFARTVLCNECGKTVGCPNCSVNLVLHKQNKKLLCHYCNYQDELPQTCPACKAPRLTWLGFGTETVENELTACFIKARIARLDRDTTKKRGSLVHILNDLKNHKIDILVGTQMLAKGHDIPNVTLVGILGTDSGLGLPDFRASERNFQLITQVAGRSGRAEKNGFVILQSFNPNHDSILLACQHDFENFFKKESLLRRELGYPPYGRMAMIRFSTNQAKKMDAFLSQLHMHLKTLPLKPATILGPAPSPLEKIKGQHRVHLLIKAPQAMTLHQAIAKVENLLQKMGPSGLKWAIDVDPLAML